MTRDQADPKRLIEQSFEIDGIGSAECRTIFLDWALSLPDDIEVERAVRRLIQRHQDKPADHPMHGVLREALGTGARPARRGGWKGRRS